MFLSGGRLGGSWAASKRGWGQAGPMRLSDAPWEITKEPLSEETKTRRKHKSRVGQSSPVARRGPPAPKARSAFPCKPLLGKQIEGWAMTAGYRIVSTTARRVRSQGVLKAMPLACPSFPQTGLCAPRGRGEGSLHCPRSIFNSPLSPGSFSVSWRSAIKALKAAVLSSQS